MKSATREKRGKDRRPIRRVIETRSVPLPKNWLNFMALPANKADLARFLSEKVVAHREMFGDVVVVAGGFANERGVAATHPELEMEPLRASHEESDTRIILHAAHSPYSTIVVSARDTDVLALLLHHFDVITCQRFFMTVGTARARTYIPVHKAPTSRIPGPHFCIRSFRR